MMRIYLQTFVTCFGTMEPSLLGYIQVSDHFSIRVFFYRPYTCQLVCSFLIFPLASLHFSFIPPVMSDARSTNRIGNYTKFWDKDRENEKSEVQGARVDNYTEVVNGNLALHLPPLHTNLWLLFLLRCRV